MATFPNQPNEQEDALRPAYDFRSLKGVQRGKYAAKYQSRLRLIRLADDIGSAFVDEQAVNDALREYLRQRETLAVS